MRASLPSCAVVSGHPHFSLLSEIREELINRAGSLARIQTEIPDLLRETIDDVIKTSRTGRRSYEELEKTEKTYIGTRVEIFIRSFFQLPKGRLDLSILGHDVDVKFTVQNNWMMPREVIDHPCLLLAADEKRSRCYFGLFVADPSYLTISKNQDKKKQISAAGFEHILWLFRDHPLPPNFWRTVSADVIQAIVGERTGNGRVMALFRSVQGRPITRDVIDGTARQKDFTRRVRADKGRGTRDLLAREGILVLSGTFDQPLIAALGLGPVAPGEFISHAPSSDREMSIVRSFNKQLGG